MASLDQTDGEQRPVCPRDAVAHVGRCHEVVGGPQRAEVGPAARLSRDLLRFGGGVLRRVRDVGPDRDVFGTELPHHVVDVIEQLIDVARAAQPT